MGQSGLEAWRVLVMEYEPRSRGQQRHALNRLLRVEPAATMEGTMTVIETWEKDLRDYETRYTDSVPDQIRCGVLTHLAPERVRVHLYLNEANYVDYASLRRVISDYVEAQRTAGMTAGLSDGVVPMGT